MNITPALQKSAGINVFGSAIIRVEPDLAGLNFAVSRLEKQPQQAFQQARQAAQTVRAFLAQEKLDEVGSSRLVLSQTRRYSGGEDRFIGYTARVEFNVLLRNLDHLEMILIGVIEAGANEITSVDFQTSRLKVVRAEARQRAVEAAREKAEIYCQAAGVQLGRVIYIQDMNPDTLGRREGQTMTIVEPEDDGQVRAFDPGSIVVGGAVQVTFEL